MNNNILEYSKIINDTHKSVNNYFNSINKVLFDHKVQGIIEDYKKKNEDQREAAFNIFNLISDKYYYENFHSDIIAAFLDSSGQHKESDRFLKVFLTMLEEIKPDFKINFKDFKSTKTLREDNRIDILIQDDETRKAIIIENKINNAPDMHRQLPRYVDKIGKCNVVAIVYLPLDPNKRPNEEGWDSGEKEFIKSKLICLPANDFFKRWLERSISEAKNPDSKEILNQYSKLIKKIGGNTMDYNIYQEFYENIMKDKEKFNMAMSLANMVNEFPLYLAERIKNEFINNYKPFNSVKSDQTATTFEWYTLNNVKLKIVISYERDKTVITYRLRFWEQNYNENGTKNILKIINYLKYTDFTLNPNDQNEYERRFIFPDEEQKLYEFIEKFKNDLASIKHNIFE